MIPSCHDNVITCYHGSMETRRVSKRLQRIVVRLRFAAQLRREPCLTFSSLSSDRRIITSRDDDDDDDDDGGGALKCIVDSFI